MEFEFQVGDKVRCKKFLHSKNSFVRFYQGTEYEIINVFKIGNSFDDYIITVKNGKLTYRFGYPYTVSGNLPFGDYFYSKKEIRKMKLSKLNNNI